MKEVYSLKRFTFTFFFIVFVQTCFAQTNWVTDSLSVLNERIRVAKQSNNNNAVLQSYFGNTFAAKSAGTTNEDFEKVTEFIRQGIDFAKSVNKDDYAASGYIHIAGIHRNRNELDKAIQNVFLAISITENSESDSVKALAYIELGDCYEKKSEPVEASKNFTTALDLALESESPSLESKICRRLANLYLNAGDSDEAKRQVYKSVSINKGIKSGEGLIEDYTQLERVTDDAKYIDTVITIADSLGLQDKIFEAKKFLLAIYGFVYNDPKRALDYINSNKDIKDDIMKNGISGYYYYLGQLFRYGKMPDSGLYYLKLAEPWLIDKYGMKVAKNIYLHMAVCYQLKNYWPNAIYYYEKMLGYSREYNDRPKIAEVSDSLSKLYDLTGDYKKAYDYKLFATVIKDSLARAAKEKKLVLLEIVRETKKHEEQLRQEEERETKKHNLQYLGITIGICVVFLCFLLLGMFQVSKLVIRIFGYIYFICVFEFIVLLIEHSVLHPITHGDPLKLWALKIVLIALLVPVQQFLEHKLIHFLQSPKLHKVRTKLKARKRRKKKKPAPPPDNDVEIDTGIL